MLELFLISLLIMLASLVGKLTVWRGGESFVERNLDYLVSFSSGVFLVFLIGLSSETLEHASSQVAGLGWIVAGAVGIWLVFKLSPNAHTHHEKSHTHPPLDARRLLLTDGLHNFADGIFLAASYLVNPGLAAVAGISIFVHEALQEVSEFFVLRDAGYSTKKALWVNFAVSSTILLGAIGGYFLLETFEILEAPLLGIASGGILVVLLHDLIPHSLRGGHSLVHYAKHLAWFVIGVGLMFGVTTFLPHVEAPEEALVDLAA